MRLHALISLGMLGAFALAVAGCGNGYYSVGGAYSEGGGYVARPPGPPPGPPPGLPPGPPPGPGGTVGVPVEPEEGAEVDVSIFYERLAPHGRWVVAASYGRVFVPSGVPAGWRPYTVGHWEYTDYGWTWVSAEPFGWATCHYGGWTMVPQHGWVWVPGTTWGPAWVAWREGDGYCGWAPLPPRHGVEVNVSITSGIPANHFTFVEERHVTAPRVHEHMVSVQKNTTIINRTTNITNIRVVNNKVVNQSLNVNRVERATGRKIQPKVIRTVDRPGRSEVRGGEVEVYRPKVERRPPAPKPNVVQPAPKPQPKVTPAVKPNAQYDAEKRKVDNLHARQLKDLEAKHAKEKLNRGNLTPAQLQKRHEAEASELHEQQRRQQIELRRKHKLIDDK